MRTGGRVDVLRAKLSGLRRGHVALGVVAVLVVALSTTLVVAGTGSSERDGAEGTANSDSSPSSSTSTSSTSTSTSTSSSTSTTSPSPSTVTTSAAPRRSSTTVPFVPPPVTEAPPAPAASDPPRGPGGTLDVGTQYPTLQAALDVAQPGDTVRLATAGAHQGPAITRTAGSGGSPITLTAVNGARLDCGAPKSGQVARCLSIADPYYVLDGFAVTGGSSNVYLQGENAGEYVHHVVIKNSVFRGLSGTGECIRVKYQAYAIEIAGNDIADCGLDKCCSSSKNGEAVYIGTAPEQLADKNPSPEPDRTHDVWVHHNVMHPYNECVDIKEAAYGNLIENNTCGGQRDDDSGAFDSRGGRVGEANTFRSNTIESAAGACVRFGGDEEPDGTGNDFYGNICRNIAGYGVKAMMVPQGRVCGNVFEGAPPGEGFSNQESIDPTAPC